MHYLVFWRRLIIQIRLVLLEFMIKTIVVASKFISNRKAKRKTFAFLYFDPFSRCSFFSRDKAVMAFTVLTAISLGLMVFLSHLVTFVKQDRILDWLIPLCFFLLSFAVISIFITLIIAGTDLEKDVRELRYSWTLIEQTLQNRLTNILLSFHFHFSFYSSNFQKPKWIIGEMFSKIKPLLNMTSDWVGVLVWKCWLYNFQLYH